MAPQGAGHCLPWHDSWEPRAWGCRTETWRKVGTLVKWKQYHVCFKISLQLVNCGYFWSPRARFSRVFRWLKVYLSLYCNSQGCLQYKQTDKQVSVNGCRCLGWCGVFKYPIESHTDRFDSSVVQPSGFLSIRTFHALSFWLSRGWKRCHSQKWVQMKKIDY